MHRKLGTFVICVAAVQMALYTALVLWPDRWDGLFYLDPRIGWAVLESLVTQSERIPGISSWLTAAVTLTVGLMLFRGRRYIRLYLIAEAILATPTLLFLVWVAAANISSPHGFSVGELLVPALMFFLCSAMPFAAALWFDSKAAH
jgi:hypothetical protein